MHWLSFVPIFFLSSVMVVGETSEHFDVVVYVQSFPKSTLCGDVADYWRRKTLLWALSHLNGRA